MGDILGVIEYIAVVTVVGTMMYARGLYLELKKTKEKLQEAQATIECLEEELEEVYFCDKRSDAN